MEYKEEPTLEELMLCPYEGKILSFYKGRFDSVYVLLHPFTKLTKINIDQYWELDAGTEKSFLDVCEPISWHEILELAGLNNLSEIDLGLRTSISGIKKELSNESVANKLYMLQREYNIVQPAEGIFSPLIESRIFKIIKSLGYNKLWVGREYQADIRLYDIDDLIEKDLIPSNASILAQDYSLLITTHWDSHCTFLCSSREIIERLLAIENFEGFYCTPKTEVYWGAHEI